MAVRKDTVQVDVEINGQRAGQTLAELEKESRQLVREVRKLVPGTEEYIKKTKELRGVKGRVKEIKQEMFGIGKAQDAGSKGFLTMANASKVAKTAFKAAMAALLPLLAFQQIVEWGKHFLGVAGNVNQVKQNLKNLTGEQGEALDRLTAKTRALGKTLDLDVNKIAEVANANSKQFGISYEEALGKLEKGLIKAGPKAEEFLEQMGEYPAKFAEAGSSMDAMISIVDNGIVNGVFSDKAPDAVKEFSITMATELDKVEAATKELEQATGSTFADQLIKDIKTGEKGTSEALKIIAGEINKLPPDSRAAQKAVSEIFKGAGEDAGVRFIQSLADMDDNLDNLLDTTDAYVQRQQEQLRLEEELALAEAELGVQLSGAGSLWSNLTTQVQLYATQALVAVINGMDYLLELFNNSGAALEGLKQGFVASFQQIGKSVVKYLGGVGDIITGILTLDVDKLKSGFSNAIGAYKDQGTAFANGFQEGYEGALSPEQIAEREARKLEKAEAKHAEQRSAARQVQNQKEQAAAKQHADKLAAARQKERQARLAADRALQDLRIEMMAEGADKEIAQLHLDYARQREAVAGSAAQMAEQRALLKEQELLKIAEVEEKYRQLGIQQQEERYAQELEDVALREEADLLKLEEKFLNAALTDEAFYQAQQDRQRAAMEARLSLLEQQHGAESLEYQRQQNEILAFDAARVAQQEENERQLQETKRQVVQEGVATFSDAIGSTLALLGEEEAGRKKNADFIKTFEAAKVGVSLATEIQEIWKYANSNPANALFPGAGTLIAVGKSVAAGARAALAIRNINSAKFARGGVVGGSSHAQGGIALLDRRSGREVGEMEGDEIILTKGVTQDPALRAAASQINYLGGGRLFADGGMVNPYSGGENGGGRPDTGGTAGVSATAAADAGQANADNPSSVLPSPSSNSEAVVSELQAIRAELASLDLKIKAYVSVDELEDEINDRQSIRDNAAFKS